MRQVDTLQVFEFEGSRVEAIVSLEVMDLGESWGVVRKRLLDRQANGEAAYAAERISYSGRPFVESAVYVLEKTGTSGCKVGLSRRPEQRARDMMVGASPDLALAALFWVVDDQPFTLERMAVQEAGRRGRRVNGEWLDMPPENAAELIYDRAQQRGGLVATSDMHLRNMGRIAQAEHDEHFAFLSREWGKSRALFWRDNNPVAIVPGLCQWQ